MRAPNTISLRIALTQLVNEGAKTVCVLFSSDGGSTDDGMSLYTFIRALPLDVTFHAVGIVGSIAIPVFLAADKRLASENAHFFFHEYSWTYNQAATVTQTTMDEQALLLKNAMRWTQRIIKSRTKLTDKDFEASKMFDHPVIMDARRASSAGIVSGVAEPSIPADNRPLVVT